MTQSTALLIEASGIQEYIFGSNQLSQNIGASELVTQATTDWLFDERSGCCPDRTTCAELSKVRLPAGTSVTKASPMGWLPR